MVFCKTLWCSVLQCDALWYSAMHCNAVWCTVIHCDFMPCTVMHWVGWHCGQTVGHRQGQTKPQRRTNERQFNKQTNKQTIIQQTKYELFNHQQFWGSGVEENVKQITKWPQHRGRSRRNQTRLIFTSYHQVQSSSNHEEAKQMRQAGSNCNFNWKHR